jgi:hypothetical protein
MKCFLVMYFCITIFLLSGCQLFVATDISNKYNKYDEPIIANKALCHWRNDSTGYLPDVNCTPGRVLDATKKEICVSGYTKTVRNVSGTIKEQVYINYGILIRQKGEYEMDHLIPLELGGSNSILNLFPQPAEPFPGFHEKDKVENYLRRQVCDGKMKLQDAQHAIATNWTEVYWQVYS